MRYRTDNFGAEKKSLAARPTLHVNRFRRGLVFKAQRLAFHSTVGLKAIKKETDQPHRADWRDHRRRRVPDVEVLRVRPGGNPREINGFFIRLPYKCHLEEVASMED